MKVTALSVKDQYSAPDAFAGTAYSYTLTALNAAGSVTWTGDSNFPMD